MNFFKKDKKNEKKYENGAPLYPTQPPPAPMTVPINYYPNNIYQAPYQPSPYDLESSFDHLDAAITDAMDTPSNIYNRVRDPRVPPPPGSVSVMMVSAMPSTSGMQYPTYGQPTAYGQPAPYGQPNSQMEKPPSYDEVVNEKKVPK